MKKINKFLFVALASVLFVTLYSCQEDNIVVDPSTLLINGASINGSSDSIPTQGVYFPEQEASGDHTFDPTMDKVITVQMARTNAEGAITVPVVVTASEEGIFNVGTASFADGQTETTFDIEFPNVETAVKYTLNLAVTDPSYASMFSSNPSHLDLSVFCVEWKWFGEKDHKFVPVSSEEEAAVFDVTFDWFEVETPAKAKYYEVGDYRTGVLLAQDEVGFFGTKVMEVNFVWNTKNNDLYVAEQYMGWDYKNQGDGDIPDAVPLENAEEPVFFYDWFSYWYKRGQVDGTAETFFGNAGYRGNYPPSYYDGNGGFIFNLKYFIPAENGGWSGFTNDFRALAQGFIRVDYTLEVETDFSSEGVVPVYYKELGKDVAEIKYVAVGGELTAREAGKIVDAIVNGTQEGVQSIKDFSDGGFGLSFNETGLYTVVLVGYDAAGKAQSDTYIVVNYVSANDNETYSVNVYVGTEDTPARYEGDGLDAIHSFAYYVVGQDLTDAHIAIVDNKKYEANTAAYNAAVKAKAGVDENTLALINATGGYYDVASGLTASTEYVVLVWATNGYLETIATATYTTAEDPETWHALGTGLYTEDCMTTFFNVQNLTYEVQIEESDRTPGRYRVVNPYGAAYPYNEEGDYDADNNYYMIINAENPEAVWMPRFDTGMNWGYDNVLIISYAGYMIERGYSLDDCIAGGVPFGTLADGVITFPAEALLIQMPGHKEAWSYSNVNGLFKVVLPSAYNGGASTAPAMRVNRTEVNATSKVEKPASRFVREPQAVKTTVSANVHPKTPGRDKPISVEKPCTFKF
ncbi:MAG: hypothetical protein J5698_05325 [Bacteroidaceae bacterium]|nr:hypothetical protein [Bacteroidaceae bacterium]